MDKDIQILCIFCRVDGIGAGLLKMQVWMEKGLTFKRAGGMFPTQNFRNFTCFATMCAITGSTSNMQHQ